MADLNRALQKYSVGDGVTDAELDMLLEHFNRMERDLGTLCRHYDKSYGLAHRAVLRDVQTLTSFKDARERHKKEKVKAPKTGGKSDTMEWLDGIMNRGKP